MGKQPNSLLKNTIALYTRMLFSVCVNLYISRVVLDVLGVDDFGIYNIVGGIVTLLGFINSSMSGSTSRFLTIAIGEKDEEKLEKTYSSAKHLHMMIALVILLLGETVGLWIVNGYLNIPEGREVVANWVYQLSLFTTVFSILQVPYSSIIISFERLDIYAGIEILHILLKLAVVIALGHYLGDRLLMYGVLLLAVGVAVFFVYHFYCRSKYKKYKFSRQLNWSIIKPMMTFSGWDMLGWGGLSACTQGRQIFMNKFFGVAMNAANGVAGTASAALLSFTNNIVMAFRPRIIKHYAKEDYVGMQRLLELAMQVIILLMSFLIVPLYFCMEDILKIWLIEIPDNTLMFCRLLLLFSYVEIINTVIKIGIHASGKMRDFTIAGFVLNMLSLVLTYVAYKLSMSVFYTYYIAIVISFVTVGINLFFLKKFVGLLDVVGIIKKILVANLACIIGFALASFWSVHTNLSPLVNFVLLTLINGLLVGLFVFVIFTNQIKRFVKREK